MHTDCNSVDQYVLSYQSASFIRNHVFVVGELR